MPGTRSRGIMRKLFRVLSFISFIACACSSCDPVFAITKTPAKDISANVADFDGNLSENDTDVQKALQTLNDMPVVGSETDPVFVEWLSTTPPIYSETDPVFSASEAHSINSTDTAAWDTAYSDRMKWDGGSGSLNATTGRSSLGLGSAATASVNDFATATQGSHGETAYGWGDHAQAGYVTGTPWTSEGYLTDAPSDGSQYLRLNGAWSTVTIPAGTTRRAISVTFDGVGTPPAVNSKARIRIPYSGTITGWTITSDVSGSCVVGVWKDTYTNYPPLVADAIAGTEKPTLSSATKNQDLSLTTWTTLAVTEGDILIFNVESASILTQIFISLDITAST